MIRKATQEDIERIVHLRRELYAKWDAMDEMDKIIDLKWFDSDEHRNQLIESISSDSEQIFVAELDDSLIGYILCEDEERQPFLARAGYVSEVFVAPESRKSGIARKLCAAALDWFKEKGLKYSTVSTHVQDSEANLFWEKQGYKHFNATLAKKLL